MELRAPSKPARALALLLILLAAAIAGCGSSSSGDNGLASKSPTEIVEAAKTAAAGAASVHVAGSIVSEGKPITLDMELVAGKGGKGRITLEGVSIDLIQVDKAVYINASAAFYRHIGGSAAAQLLQGKWLKAPENSKEFSSLAQLTDLGKLINGTLAAHGALTKAPERTIEGQKAVGVTDSSKGGTLYVAATGTAYPLELVKTGASGGRIVFNRWNQPVSLAPPPNPISVSQLQSGH
jgi:hypothetical protein